MVFVMGMRSEKVEFWWEIASDRRRMTHDCILAEFGLNPVLGTNCLHTNRQLIVFFYVDNIAVLFAKKDLLKLE